MRWAEIIQGDDLTEAKPVGSSGSIPPLTPARARQKAKKDVKIQNQKSAEQHRHADRMKELTTRESQP